MKKLLFLMLMILGGFMAYSQSTVTVTAQSDELANDLDLKAVATLYGEAATVEDFEHKLNDETLAISNLDLNGDGQVDYLRCIETNVNGDHYIVIQAVLAKDIYQDVATIYTTKDKSTGEVTTQVVGNEYIYGANYIVQPVYIRRPVIYDWYYSPSYVYWYSPYYWGYYPNWYHHCYYRHHDVYWRHIHDFHHRHYNSFNHPHRPHPDMKPRPERHDGYANQHPGQGYNDRHPQGTNIRTEHSGSPTRMAPSGTVRQPVNSTVAAPRRGEHAGASVGRTSQQPNRSASVQTSRPTTGSDPVRSGGYSPQPTRTQTPSSVRPSSPAPSRSGSSNGYRSAPTTTTRPSSPAPSRSGSSSNYRPAPSSTSRPSSGSPSRSGSSGPSRSGGGPSRSGSGPRR